MWLVQWLGVVGLFALVVRSVAVGWLRWIALRLGGVLFELALMGLLMLAVGGLRGLGCWAVAECCWLMISVLLLGRWFVGVCRHKGDSLVDGVLFVLEQVMSGVLFRAGGWVGVM